MGGPSIIVDTAEIGSNHIVSVSGEIDLASAPVLEETLRSSRMPG